MLLPATTIVALRIILPAILHRHIFAQILPAIIFLRFRHNNKQHDVFPPFSAVVPSVYPNIIAATARRITTSPLFLILPVTVFG